MKPNICIVGPSGSGKSSSLRNCDPLTSAVINSEQKALPFKGAGKFKMNIPISGMEPDKDDNDKLKPSMNEYWRVFNKAMASEKVNMLVNESFTSLAEQQFAASGRFYEKFDLWGDFKTEIGKILHRAKNTSKYVVFIGIDGVIDGENGVEERFMAIDGYWKKKVEKEFVIVLYTDCRINEETGDPEYIFITNKQKGHEHVSAKSPMGMLPLTMPNDLAEVIRLAELYYNDETEAKETPKKEVESTTK